MQTTEREGGKRASERQTANASVGPFSGRSARAWMLAIFIIALTVRVLHIWGDMRSPFFSFRGIDALDYHQMALGMHNGTWPAHQPFFWAPLYPLFLGILYGVIGQGALALKLVQAIIGSLSCVLLYRIGRRLFQRSWIAAAAGLAAAINGTMIYFDGQLLSANLDVFLQLLALELLLSAAVHRMVGGGSSTPDGVWHPAHSSLRWWAAGVVIGLSAINRGAILLLLPFLVIWLWGVLRRNWAIGQYTTVRQMTGRSAAHAIAAALLPTCVLVGFVVLHNVHVDSRASGGRMGLLPVAHNMGINFYLGNHLSLREINKTGHPQHFSHYDEIMMLPVQAGVSGAFAASQFLFHQTLEDITADPGKWLHLMLVKVGELGHGAEIPRSGNLYAVRSHSPVLAALLWKNIIAFPSGVVIPLGLVGMALALRGWRGHWLPLAMALTQCGFVLMFFVTARYRLPAMPLVTLYGVFAIERVVAAMRTRKWRRTAALIAAIAALGVACNWRVSPGDEEHGYYEYALLAQVHDQAGRLDEAIVNYQEALRLNPDYAWAHLQLGAASLRWGDLRPAERHLRIGIELEPNSPNVPIARLNLGRVLARQRQLREAVEVWEAALAQDPQVPLVRAELCDALHRLGREREAQPHCTAAAEMAARRMRGQ